MKKFWLFLATIAIFLVTGCSKEDDGPVPPDNPQTTKITFSINTDFPDGVSVQNLEIFFESDKKPLVVRAINMGLDTVTFTGQEAKDLLGGDVRIGLTFVDPLLGGQPCTLLFSGEEFIFLTVKENNQLSWSLSVDPNPQEQVMFIVTAFFPEGVTVETLGFGIFCQETAYEFSQEIFPNTTDTIYFTDEQAANFVGKECVVSVVFSEAFLDGNLCFPIPVESNHRTLIPETITVFEQHYVLP